MDSEKNAHMRDLLEKGRPVTDEGPYYHHAWWESYKGSVKGKLGGGILGTGIGAVTGAVAAGAAALLAPAGVVIGVPALALTVGGFAAAGMIYGVHEFAEVGKVTGAVASTQKTAEKRMKAFEDSKFAEIKEEIGELKAIIKGEPVPEKKATAEAEALKEAQDDYRTEHFQGSKVDGIEQFIFPKIALLGLVIGVVAGALLGYSELSGEILHKLGAAATPEGFGELGNLLAPMTACGAVGASFGINRDLFRQAFDRTDMWFRGFISHDHSRKVLLGTDQIQQSVEKSEEMPSPAKQTVFYDGHVAYPQSETYHRDKYAAAKQVLQEMDHTKMSPH